jgi:N-acetylmuramic acid 6-phosphate etherase
MVRAVSAGVVIALFAVVVTQVPRTSCATSTASCAGGSVVQPMSDEAIVAVRMNVMLRCMVNSFSRWGSYWYSIGITAGRLAELSKNDSKIQNTSNGGFFQPFLLEKDRQYWTFMLRTETPNSAHAALDQYATDALVSAFVDDQINAVNAVRAAGGDLARAVEAALPRIRAGGRLVYAGAGTSGRLGLLDSVELLPTFSWPSERAVALLAGGASAVYKAVEGAEDSREDGAADMRVTNVTANDVVIVLAASGTTPYALGAIDEAKSRGALTIGMANNPAAPVTAAADIGITLDTGSEVISGSTRLKAGTAQKIALNTFSSALMVRLNKVYGNLMVDVKPTNAKLVKRTVRLTMLATGCDETTAIRTLETCDHHVKTAVVAIKAGVDAAEANAMLAQAEGSVQRALDAAYS